MYGKTKAGEVYHWVKEVGDKECVARCSGRFRLVREFTTIFPEKMMCSTCLRYLRGKVNLERARVTRKKREATWPKKWLPWEEV